MTEHEAIAFHFNLHQRNVLLLQEEALPYAIDACAELGHRRRRQ